METCFAKRKIDGCAGDKEDGDNGDEVNRDEVNGDVFQWRTVTRNGAALSLACYNL